MARDRDGEGDGDQDRDQDEDRDGDRDRDLARDRDGDRDGDQGACSAPPGPVPALTAAEVTEDLLKSRSASLNLRFLRSFLLLEFLEERGSHGGGPARRGAGAAGTHFWLVR